MIDISDYKGQRIHFIGIGGCSMSCLAQILDNLGYSVSGSDQRQSAFTDTLQKRGIPVEIGHDAAHAEGAGLVVYTAAIKPSNPEYSYAVQHHIPMLERSVLLGQVSRDYKDVVCVSGCHGKTTITSMLALITQDSGIDPTVHVGGMVDFLSGGVKLGKSEHFITEACEYVRSFLTLHPTYIILNNIDDDHLDYYKDIDEIIDTFVDFIRLLPKEGIVFANTDDANTRRALARTEAHIISYSLSGNSDFGVENVAFDDMGCPSFNVVHHGESLGHVSLHIPGMHNVQNALAAIALAYTVYGISVADAAKALAHYHLAGRRFELVGEKDGVKIFHDYAHHPSEIRACLAGAKKYPHKKLWVVFQCNSFTRAKTLKDKYALAFDDADEVLVPDLYPGRDIDLHDIHATDLVTRIDAHSHNCRYIPTFQEIKEYLRSHWQSGDIVVTLGSGDVNKQQMVFLED